MATALKGSFQRNLLLWFRFRHFLNNRSGRGKFALDRLTICIKTQLQSIYKRVFIERILMRTIEWTVVL